MSFFIQSVKVRPGIASISKTSGEPIPAANLPKGAYPDEAFREAMELTRGMPYKKRGTPDIKGSVTEPEDVTQTEQESEETAEVSSADYIKILETYTDKNGRISYDLLNKDMIKFAHSSSIIRKMAENNASVEEMKDYTVLTKFRTVTGNKDLTEKEALLITSLLDEVSPKGVFKELESELRKMLRKR